MIPKPLDTIEKDDLFLLIEEEVCESRTIEFKQRLDVSDVGKKIEFLKDLSALANASGGDLVFGMAEVRGRASKLFDLAITDRDHEEQKLQNLLQSGLEPRLSGVGFKWVLFSESEWALVIRIRQSLNAPHRVCRLDDSGRPHNRFYIRNSNGVQEMDVNELRTSFTLYDSLKTKMEEFREERIDKIFHDQMPAPIQQDGKIVLQILPISSFGSGSYIDLHKVYYQTHGITDLYLSKFGLVRFNYDGVLFYNLYGDYSTVYTQIFRQGMIEVVNSWGCGIENGQPVIYMGYEGNIVNWCNDILRLYQALEVAPPFFIFISLVNVYGYTMMLDNRFSLSPRDMQTIDDDILDLPEAVAVDYDFDPKVELFHTFNAAWQACNVAASQNYDKDGNWRD